MMAIVTGGAGSIGRATAEALLANGWSVTLVDRADSVNEVAEEIGAVGCEADITSSEDRARIAETAPTPKALVNVAGIGRIVPLLETSEELWRETLEVNLTSAFLLSQQTAKAMTQGGALVNVASISGQRASAGRVAYGTSKAAMIQMSNQFAVELGHLGIRCNTVAPGPVDTPMAREHPASNVQDYLKAIPQGRYAQPSEIADTIAFLLSDRAGHITGQCVCVDGGWVHAGVGVASLN